MIRVSRGFQLQISKMCASLIIGKIELEKILRQQALGVISKTSQNSRES